MFNKDVFIFIFGLLVGYLLYKFKSKETIKYIVKCITLFDRHGDSECMIFFLDRNNEPMNHYIDSVNPTHYVSGESQVDVSFRIWKRIKERGYVRYY